MNYKEIIYKIRNSNRKHNFYLINGEDAYFHEMIIKELIQMLKIDFVEKIYGDEINLNEFVNYVSGGMLFSSNILVIIKKAEKIKKTVEKEISEFIEKVDKTTLASTVVFMYTDREKTLDLGENALYKVISRTGVVIPFEELGEYELSSFIRQEIENSGKKISQSAVDYLLSQKSNNLYELKNEIEKLVLWAGNKREITEEDIQNCVEYSDHKEVQELIKAIQINKVNDGIRIYTEFLERTKTPMQVINSIFLNYVKKNLYEKTLNTDKIVNILGELCNMDVSVKSGKESDPYIFLLNMFENK